MNSHRVHTPVHLILALAIIWIGPAMASSRMTSSLTGKVIVGYQGWFSCPDDKTGLKSWDHWLNTDGSPAIDELPDTSEFPPQAGCSAPFIRDHQGMPVMLYSAQNPRTVEVQLEWLKDNNISGLAVQRFILALKNENIKKSRDIVLDNIRAAAEKTDRTFFICYDISGGGDSWADDLQRDWFEIEAKITQSPAYLFDHGRPVVEIWGLGINNRPQTPLAALQVINNLRSHDKGAYVIAGVPVNWSRQTHPASNSHSWSEVYKVVDAISPWMVNAFKDRYSFESMERSTFDADIIITQRRGQGYMPVVFPGFSNFNETRGAHAFNSIPRRCGSFLRDQLNFWRQKHVSSLYVAMFDEANEGTSIFKSKLPDIPPDSHPFLRSDPNCPNEQTLYLRTFQDFNLEISR